MTSAEALQIQEALSIYGQEIIVTSEDPKGSVWKFTFPFHGVDGKPFRVYAFRASRGRKVYLSDGKALLRAVRGCGDPQLRSIQQLAESYGLSLMEDLTIMDTSNRPIAIRAMAFIQAWCAIDGMIRIWKIKQEEVRNAIRPTGRHRSADEAIQPRGEEETRAA